MCIAEAKADVAGSETTEYTGSIPALNSKIKTPVKGVFILERMTGIEPAPSAWKAEALPLSYIRLGRLGRLN